MRATNPRRRVAAYISALTAVLGGGVAAAQTTTEESTSTESTTATVPVYMSALELQALRKPLRDRANTNRLRKFRQALYFTFGPWHFAPEDRARVVLHWKRRLWRSWELTPHPLYARALHWYYTSGAECVHKREGAWNDPNAPYWGGMQADLSFQTSYGWEFYRRWGTADRWPAWAQIVMSYRGWRVRGWSPWPLTARDCGLL